MERVAPAAQGLPIPSSGVVARISKAAGTPGALPDFIGLAIRVAPQQVEATPWDILLVSSGSGVLARAVALRPTNSWSGQTLTSLMPFRYRGAMWWLRARSLTDVDGFGLSLASVRTAIEQGGIEFAIDQAAVDSRDFGGPVYALTDDNGAVIVGLYEGMWRSAPAIESWQAVMQQVYIDTRSQGGQQPGLRLAGW